MHIEILQSPWLCELMAFHINLRETKAKKRKGAAFFDGCSLVFDDGKPSLSCELLDSVKIDIDLTCSICLVSLLFSSITFTTIDKAGLTCTSGISLLSKILKFMFSHFNII